MSNKNANSPAIPVMDESGVYGQHYGLTKRESIAMAAMQGILSSKFYADFCSESNAFTRAESAAEMAVEHADALLAKLEK